jgi:hypothetical protein
VTCAFPVAPELTIEIKDYASMPVTGAVDGVGNSAGLLARINFLREEPGGSRKRFFVNDLNGRCTSSTGHEETHHLSELQRPRRSAWDISQTND